MVFPFDLSSIVRKDLDKLVAYDTPLYSNVVKLDANENPYPFPAEVAQRLGELVADEMLSRYPDGEAVALRRDIAAYLGVTPEQIMVGNGSDELILNLLLTFGTGGRVFITNPTFSMYRIHCLVAGAKPIPIPRREDFSLDVPALLCYARKPDSRVLFICSPNNPTGNASTLEEIESVLQAVNCLVVVDQAYLEFGGQDCLPLLQRYPHLVILRTFSKAYALAGLRVGYMIGNPDVLRQIKKVKQPFNLNAFSQAAARLVLQHREIFTQQIQDLIESRNQLWQELQGMAGVTPYPSVTNYILFRTNYESKTVYQGLLDKGIVIRKLGGPELPGFLRVSVGTPEQNQRFIQALSAVLAELGGE